MVDLGITSVSPQVGDLGANTDSELIKVHQKDELRLAQMGRFEIRNFFGTRVDCVAGHKQELKRHFSIWSLVGLAANCTISWTGKSEQHGCLNRF